MTDPDTELRTELGRHSEGEQISGTTVTTPSLSVWARAAQLGRAGADEDDPMDEQHILRGLE
ncbi:hypothetical protein [Micromonospora inositola]|uniref:Uncharacterized protein n=1 Tax=Micromonospora inositola TaxID=47865 RepID=A0A1C5JR57_9ACTN|nr:hypothetical protein [Micromonospora inositola]SCG72963.1 hypothetical protein GA0070613_5204 [Micromonospora inositola]